MNGVVGIGFLGYTYIHAYILTYIHIIYLLYVYECFFMYIYVPHLFLVTMEVRRKYQNPWTWYY